MICRIEKRRRPRNQPCLGEHLELKFNDPTNNQPRHDSGGDNLARKGDVLLRLYSADVAADAQNACRRHSGCGYADLQWAARILETLDAACLCSSCNLTNFFASHYEVLKGSPNVIESTYAETCLQENRTTFLDTLSSGCQNRA